MRRLASPLLACAVSAALLAVALPGAARAAGHAAEVVLLRGEAVAVSESGVSRTLRAGAELFAGDRVETGAGAAVRLRFTDETGFELGERTTFRIDDYAYGRGAGEDRITTRIVKGIFRFVSGLIARRTPRSMRVGISVASVGIRGTRVAGEVEETSAVVVLLEPEAPGRPSAIEVANDFGSVVIDRPGFGTEIPDAESPPSPPRRMQLRALQNLIRTLQSIQRIRPPRIR